ncbi:MAG: hydrogenase maturation nickel metallochaperone HypA [Pseudomonadota bacterium]
MHEMALCQGMIDLIEDQREQQDFTEVRRVVVEIGALGDVDPDALAFAFDVVAADGVAAAATLDIREIPGRGWCMDCSESIEVARRGDGCPKCGNFMLIMEQGEELRLKELEVA